jgi:biopolymer transport protein ExbB
MNIKSLLPTRKILLLALLLMSPAAATALSQVKADSTMTMIAQSEHWAGQSDFQRFFMSGGWLVWFLLLLSVVTVTLMVKYFMMLRRGNVLPVGLTEKVVQSLDSKQIDQTAKHLNDKQGTLLGQALSAILLESNNGREAMEIVAADMIEQESTVFLRRIEWLNIIGNVAPMIGLFGTVWGMINAFQGIVSAGGQPEPADLAGGISTALVTTWWGLVVAIPALGGYGILRNRVEGLAAETAVSAEKVLRHLSTVQQDSAIE